MGLVGEIRLRRRLRGLRVLCQQSLLDRLASEDGFDIISFDDEDEHNGWNSVLSGGTRRAGHAW